MRKTIQIKMVLLILMAAAVFRTGTVRTHAAGERAYFGSEGYEWALDTASPIGIYAGSDQNLSSADLYVRYDSQMLEYSSGGELVEPGLVRVYGEAAGAAEFKQMVEFIPRIAGNTQIVIESGTIVNAAGESAAVAPVSVGVTIPMAEGSSLEGILVNGNPVPGFVPEVTEYRMEVAGDVGQAQIAVLPAERPVEISGSELAAGDNTIYITAANAAGNRARYTLRIRRPEMPVPMETEEAEAEKEPEVQAEPAVSEEVQEEGVNVRLALVMTALVLLILLAVLAAVFLKEKKRKEALRRRRRKQGAEKPERLLSEMQPAETQPEPESPAEVPASGHTEESPGKDKAEPGEQRTEERELEISVQNVTMEFKREKDESTSIKELMIRTAKGQRSYEKFKALDNVSFDIYKGEVVGIIGTNGSGKSTILKIISGALSPTGGKVEVDKNKIQLLTLGTGFDFELTGRENVYLNGAIIGYTREYIDEKYDEIVKFAELEGFMEEKVRNYSSGMVSRLGFAIATTRESPEILILDEVLSVGDRLFKEKSLKRIKEMIHGGSTVVMVSHSTATIRENCDSAVWIEKGHVVAWGNVKAVCDRYDKYDGNLENIKENIVNG